MRSALRKLCKHGIEALRPQKVNDKWRKPVISRRVAADLRKLAIRSGTYGSFDTESGEGWLPSWDAPERKKKEREAFHSALNNAVETEEGLLDTATATGDYLAGSLFNTGSNKGSISSIRPPKLHKRERTREGRAQKIENLLEQADEKIEEYRLENEKKRSKDKGIEAEFKQMASTSYW